jgi:hypothetical protein
MHRSFITRTLHKLFSKGFQSHSNNCNQSSLPLPISTGKVLLFAELHTEAQYSYMSSYLMHFRISLRFSRQAFPLPIKASEVLKASVDECDRVREALPQASVRQAHCSKRARQATPHQSSPSPNPRHNPPTSAVAPGNLADT